MKKIFLTLITLSSVNAFAFGVDLNQEGVMSVDQLNDMGAEYVQCSNPKPKCILNGGQYGIQYPGQELDEVSFSRATTYDGSIVQLKKLKDLGMCE